MPSVQAALAAIKIKYRNQLETKLREKYQSDPVGWIEERAKGFTWSKVRQIAESVRDNRRTAVPSAHEIGKSWIAARIAAWWIAVHPPGSAFVVTTAPTSKQVKVVLWKEIRRAYLTAKLNGRLNQTEWWLNGEMVAMGRKPNDYDPTAFQGIHAKYVLVIVDEGCGVPENIYLAANSLIANQYGRILVIGNPDDPDSHFAKVCRPGSGWNVIPVSAFDTPNFTGEYAPQEVKDVLVGPIFVEEMKRDVGEESNVYISKVLGQFPENAADGVVLLSWVRRCQQNDIGGNTDLTQEEIQDLLLADVMRSSPVELGIDVGAGGDETSIRERRGKYAFRMWEAKTPEAEQAYALAVRAIIETKAERVKIDTIGIGWGLIAMLRMAVQRSLIERKPWYDVVLDEEILITSIKSVDDIIPVDVGKASTDPTRFPRLRDQMWWEVGRELSTSGGWDLTFVDDVTIHQLTRPTWKPDLANRHKVESKLDMMKRTGENSPNRADALLHAFTNPPVEDTELYTIYHDPVKIGADI